MDILGRANRFFRYAKLGTGAPEGVITAPVGAIFQRKDGGAGTALYVKEAGTGNTGWAAPGIAIDNMTVTWNNIATVFTGIKLNVTDLASPAFTPKLIDLQVGGVSKFNVSKLGVVNAGSGSFTTAVLIGDNAGEFFFGQNADASLMWSSVGVIKAMDGNAGPGILRTPGRTVASLPTAAAAGSGARSFVTDANATMTAGIGTVVAAGGANGVPVYSDGAAWRIG